MCGRFSLTVNEAELNLRFETAGGDAPYVPRYNGAPTQLMPVITSERPATLSYHRWGLIPAWAKDVSIGSKMINARAETIAEKASFRKPLQSRRCLVPADGFFEWQQDAAKQPYRFVLRDGRLFAMAGIWDQWISPGGEIVRSFSIITTSANELMNPIHSRMPVILPREAEKIWLGSHSEPEIMALLKPYPSAQMEAYKISKLVNSARNDVPEILARVES